MKDSATRQLINLFIRIIIYSLVVTGAYGLIYLDVFYTGEDKFGEDSFTEWGQEICLMLMIVIFIYIARQFKEYKSFATMVAGVGIMALIREYNNFFINNFFHGSWSILVAITGIITAYLTYRERATLVSAMLDFVRRPGYGMALAGVLTTFVFSRFFGLPFLWQGLMQENYYRMVIRVVEEGTELLGYTLMLIGSVEYVLSVIADHKKEKILRYS